LKDPNTTKDICRKCREKLENIQHITSDCHAHAPGDYTHCHNQVANIILQYHAIKCGLSKGPPIPYYKYKPQSVLENSSCKLYCDRPIITARTIHNNRPNIVILEKTIKEAYLLDVAIPNSHNLQSTITEKLQKYTKLKEELIRIWQLKTAYIIPLVVFTAGIIPKQLHDSLKLLDLRFALYILMQKAVILNNIHDI
jgi:hypothetical protein